MKIGFEVKKTVAEAASFLLEEPKLSLEDKVGMTNRSREWGVGEEFRS